MSLVVILPGVTHFSQVWFPRKKTNSALLIGSNILCTNWSLHNNLNSSIKRIQWFHSEGFYCLTLCGGINSLPIIPNECIPFIVSHNLSFQSHIAVAKVNLSTSIRSLSGAAGRRESGKRKIYWKRERRAEEWNERQREILTEVKTERWSKAKTVMISFFPFVLLFSFF